MRTSPDLSQNSYQQPSQHLLMMETSERQYIRHIALGSGIDSSGPSEETADCICHAPWLDSSNLFLEARLFDVAQRAAPGRNARIEIHDGAHTSAFLLHVYAVLSMP